MSCLWANVYWIFLHASRLVWIIFKGPWWPPRGNKRAIMRIMSWSSGGRESDRQHLAEVKRKVGWASEHLSQLCSCHSYLGPDQSVDGMKGPQVSLCWRFWGALVMDTLSCAAAGTGNAFSGLSFRWQVHTADFELYRFGNPRILGIHNSFLKFGSCMI